MDIRHATDWELAFYERQEAARPTQRTGRGLLPATEELRPPTPPEKVLCPVEDYIQVAHCTTAVQMTELLCENGWYVDRASGAEIQLYPYPGQRFLGNGNVMLILYPTGGGSLIAGQATVEFLMLDEGRTRFLSSWQIWSGVDSFEDINSLHRFKHPGKMSNRR